MSVGCLYTKRLTILKNAMSCRFQTFKSYRDLNNFKDWTCSSRWMFGFWIPVGFVSFFIIKVFYLSKSCLPQTIISIVLYFVQNDIPSHHVRSDWTLHGERNDKLAWPRNVLNVFCVFQKPFKLQLKRSAYKLMIA